MKLANYFILIITFLFIISTAISKRPITFEDILKFEELNSPSITDNGQWVTYRLDKQRGNNTFVLQSLFDSQKIEIEKGSYCQYSNDTKWFAIKTDVDIIKQLNHKKYKDEKPDLELINTTNSYRETIDNISNFSLAKNGKWLVYTLDYGKEDKQKGKKLILRHLVSETEIPLDNVVDYTLDSLGNNIFYSKLMEKGLNGLYNRNLNQEYAPEKKIEADSNTKYSNLFWDETSMKLFYLSGKIIKEENTKDNALKSYDLKERNVGILADTSSREGWYIPENNEISLTEDDNRLWFGYKPLGEWYDKEKDTTEITEENLYNTEMILDETELYLWHPKDPEIIPQQINEWDRTKDNVYYSIYNFENNLIVNLADSTEKGVISEDNPNYTLQLDAEPYKKLVTYNSWYQDLYSVNLKTGEKKLIVKKLEERPYISPNGKYTIFFKEKLWYSYNNETGNQIVLNNDIKVPFYDVLDDHPKEPGSYGIRGWIGEDDKVLISDQFDLWEFEMSTGNNRLLTKGFGRETENKIYPINFNNYKRWFNKDDKVITVLSGKKSKQKHLAILDLKTGEIELKTYGEYQYLPNKKAEFSDKLIVTKEGFDTYPDIWLTNVELNKFERVTNEQEQVDEFKWGTSHLVDFVTEYGDTLQGYYALPDGYEKGKKYPVFVYFYERFSDRKNEFNMPKVNHRPPYSLYLGSDYVMFFPDVKFYNGNPGKSSEVALLAGCNKLVEMGIADPERIVIHGHSWSGYESAYIVTQTDYFAACVSGAPVSNMTSAYSGIRLGSGLARQFQYEKGQSRIGGNIIDSLDSYIRNSPIFFADQMNTPLLIMFGDADEAVPWQQGIELYLAMRRFDKNCIFLQYKDEPHHPKKIHNQLDYSMRMKQFMDYYVFGGEMPKWMLDGFRYKGTFNISK